MQVISIIFEYLFVLCETGGMSRREFREMQGMAAAAFRFRAEAGPMDRVASLASSMLRLPFRHLIVAETLFMSYDPQVSL